jgi:hypothetical protein
MQLISLLKQLQAVMAALVRASPSLLPFLQAALHWAPQLTLLMLHMEHEQQRVCV